MPVNNIIESRFQQLEKRFTGHTTLAQRTLEKAPKLSFEQPVLIAQLLFLTEGNRVIGLLSPGAPRAVDAGKQHYRVAFPTTGEAFHRSHHACATHVGKGAETVVRAARTDSAASVSHRGQSRNRIAFAGRPSG